MSEELIQFILDHEHDDVNDLLLKYKDVHGYPIRFIVNQITGRKKAKEKLPTWYSNVKSIYPPQLNLEQSSSEETAQFKAGILKDSQKLKSIADLTGGFGVDAFYFSKVFDQVIYVEPVQELSETTIANHILFETKNINHVIKTAEDFLTADQKFDWIYIDPSRTVKGRKVFRFSDCKPDVVKLLPRMFELTDNILVKASPLQDIKAGIKELGHVSRVTVVSVNNDCKELLFQLEKNSSQVPQIVCVNLQSDDEIFNFTFDEEEHANVSFSEPDAYIYEPNVSLLKAGSFRIIVEKYQLKKLAVNTHFYTSSVLIANFPGRIFKNEGPLAHPDKQLPQSKANIISRNHPLSPDQIKKKYKLSDGGDYYLLAFSSVTRKHIIVANRVK